MQTTDVVIVGAGPVGLCLARALADSDLSVAVVEPQPREMLADPAFDGREIALTHASRQILQSLGIWQALEAGEISPLRTAKVMNGASPFALGFGDGAREGQVLGWLVPNHQIRRAAWKSVLGQPRLTLRDGVSVTAIEPHADTNVVVLSDGQRLRARLVVAADSRFSATRRMMGIGAQMRDFGKSMMVCRMNHEGAHHHAAWEWFGYERTLALLPLNGNTASVVITLPPAAMQALQDCADEAFGQQVSAYFEHRLGAMSVAGTRHVYPLVGVYAQRFVGQRYALVGDAAVGMHPVTAHGFNLGLQGQHRLARAVCAAAASGADIGAERLLAGYQRGHRLAARPLYEATNAVVSLYNDGHLPARLLRNAALRVAHRAAPFRKLIEAHLTQQQVPG